MKQPLIRLFYNKLYCHRGGKELPPELSHFSIHVINLFLTYKLRLQLIQGVQREIQVAGGSQPRQLLFAVLGLFHCMGLETADVVSSI